MKSLIVDPTHLVLTCGKLVMEKMVISGFQVRQRRLQRDQRRPPDGSLHLCEVHFRNEVADALVKHPDDFIRLFLN